MEKTKPYSIRLRKADIAKIEEIIDMRSEYLNQYENLLVMKESWSDIIRTAITRMYNETFEYYMYDKVMFEKNRKEEE